MWLYRVQGRQRFRKVKLQLPTMHEQNMQFMRGLAGGIKAPNNWTQPILSTTLLEIQETIRVHKFAGGADRSRQIAPLA